MIDASDDTTESGESTVTSSSCPVHQISTAATRHKLSAEEIVETQ